MSRGAEKEHAIDNEPILPLAGHLRELRKRLIASLLAIGIAFLFTYSFSVEIYGLLAGPLLSSLPEGQRFVAFSTVTEPFVTYLKIGFVSAVFVASPVVIYEVWAFVAPGLYKDERRWFLPVVPASVILFVAGALFAHLVVFPVGFKYLLGFAGAELRPVLSMGAYFSLATKFMLAFGVVFQIPVVILVLARLGIVDARMLVLWWKYAILSAFVIGAILTPPDVVSQFLMAVPIMLLYCISIVVAYFFGEKRKG
ncbi:MAG: twin-arginine translocase subunit TatC [Deltaproteobacteria bacterium]|nr:twin-arginine translocase subunit TatC [Deltaproteobacteria bacterium]